MIYKVGYDQACSVSRKGRACFDNFDLHCLCVVEFIVFILSDPFKMPQTLEEQMFATELVNSSEYKELLISPKIF